VPAGAYKNREFREAMINISSSVDRFIQDILFDPQTSGGLLICIDKSDADELVEDLRSNGVEEAIIIGEVQSDPKGKICVI